jgi:hypothetical protein
MIAFVSESGTAENKREYDESFEHSMLLKR